MMTCQWSVAMPSELFDWQVRYLDIYLFCVCAVTCLCIWSVIVYSSESSRCFSYRVPCSTWPHLLASRRKKVFKLSLVFVLFFCRVFVAK